MRRLRTLPLGFVPLLAILGSGCATTGGLTQQDVLRQYEPISELSAGLVDAKSKDAAL